MVKDIEKLKKIISSEVLKGKHQDKALRAPGNSKYNFIFDFRKILLHPTYLDLIAETFWKHFEKEYPFQVGGMETAAIPLIISIILKGKQYGKCVNGFYIRKVRKRVGLQRIIEGNINDEKIILVDDLINNGDTFHHQIKLLGTLGKTVVSIFAILKFFKAETYSFLTEEKINLFTLFSIEDFGSNPNPEIKPIQERYFKALWYFAGPDPSFAYEIPKSTPAIDKERIYWGNDDGVFVVLDQETGETIWKYSIKHAPDDRGIFSSPVLHGDFVYFGSCDGKVFALNKNTGETIWKHGLADKIISSPALASDLELLFIGLEFALPNKSGEIIALSAETGEKRWHYTINASVHSSPAYCAQKKVVAIGSDGGYIYLFRAKDGKLLWKHRVDGPIKGSFSFDLKRNLVFFGSLDGTMYALNIDSGKMKFHYQTYDGIFSTPLVHEDHVYFSSLDKRLYCLDVDTEKLQWVFQTRGKIFSSPMLIAESIFIGSNDGKLYAVNKNTGEKTASFQTTERITNGVVYNKKSGRIFLTTYANEMYCLGR